VRVNAIRKIIDVNQNLCVALEFQLHNNCIFYWRKRFKVASP